MALGERHAVRMVNGEEVKFAKLTPNGVRAIMRELKAAKRTQLVENLKAGGVTGNDLFQTLQAFDNAELVDDDFLAYVSSIEGRTRVLLDSLANYVDAAENILGHVLDACPWVPLIAEVCSLKLRPLDELDDGIQGADAPDPTGPVNPA